jgi:TPM domain
MTTHRKVSGIGRHLVTDHRSVHRAFPPAVLKRIEAAIAAGELQHAGQLRFAVEGGLPFAHLARGEDPRERALDVFSRLRVWDTEENCGVLVYVLLADKDVEIVADRGIHRRVGDETWQQVCRAMEAAFRERRFEEGALVGIKAISTLLAQHFPRGGSGPNELPDQAIVL